MTPLNPLRRSQEEQILFTEIRLTNFKSVVEQNIPLRSLTVLVGANSSGKSSVLQALLLFVQACQSRSVGDSFPLNGGLVSLGTLTDIRNAAAGTREPVSLGLTLAVPEERLRRASRLGFGGWTDDARLGALQDPLPSMAFDLQDASRVQDEVSITASLNGEVPNEPGAAHLSQLVVKLRRKNSEGDLVDLLELDVHCRLAKSANRHEHRLNETAPYDQHFKGKLIDHGSQKTTAIPAAYVTGAIPRRLGIRRKLSLVLAEQWAMNLLERPGRFKEPSGAPVHDKGGGRLDALAERAAEEIIRRLEANETPRRLSPRLRPEHSVAVADVQYLVPKIAKALPYDEYVIDGLRTKQASELTRAAEFLGSYMSDHVRYLGPLRFEPQAVMPISPNPSGGDIGPKGEYTASVLRLLGPKIVRCPLPGVRGYEQLPLQEAVRNWLSYLDVAEDVQVIDVPQLGHTIRVLPLGLNRAVSLTHVGVGVSQILPVLVLCLLAEPETLILLEQPELHLHPATQQLLGEFLLAVSASGRQLIIETHSEHLVRRLLRSIAEDKTDRARELIGFVSSVRDRESATTVYEPIQPNSYGGFDAWPHGFFDQGPEEARQTLRAAMEKRSAEKPN